jgi:hypothetical protein
MTKGSGIDHKLWRDFSSFMKTVGFYLLLITYLSEPNALISVGALLMLAAWYLSDFLGFASKKGKVNQLAWKTKDGTRAVEEMSIVMVRYPSGRCMAIFEGQGTTLVGWGDNAEHDPESALCHLASQMQSHFSIAAVNQDGE